MLVHVLQVYHGLKVRVWNIQFGVNFHFEMFKKVPGVVNQMWKYIRQSLWPEESCVSSEKFLEKKLNYRVSPSASKELGSDFKSMITVFFICTAAP